MLRNVGRFYIPAVFGHFKAISGHFPIKWTNGPSGRRKALKSKIREN